jgi:peptidoglycan/xylan/chitin deacetylase (PgdA/CDA1 family)
MAAEGHQIASHTWSHENYSAITTAEFHNQIYYNEIALNDILGYVPRYMRFVNLSILGNRSAIC